MKKWIVLAACIIIQSVLGGVYAWSAFVPALANEHNLTNGRCGLIFGLTIAVFTVVMIPAGRVLAKYGPRITAVIGAVLFAAGYLTASLSRGSFAGIFIGISLLTGAGIGFCYVSPLTVAMKWFPLHRGLVTGIAVAGFGGGAILISHLVQYMLVRIQMNVLQVFQINGVVLGTIAIVAALLLTEPEKILNRPDTDNSVENIKSYIISKPFTLLWAGMFASTFAGLLIVGNLKPMLLSSGLDEKTAALGISVFALGNASGRILWGQIHDRIGMRKTILLSLICLGTSIPFLAVKLPVVYLLAAVAVVGANFGACFVVYASSIVEYYGTDLFPRLYPVCFLSYGLAGITGPPIGGFAADITNSYTTGVIVCFSLVFLAFLFICRRLSPRGYNVNNCLFNLS